MKKVRAALVAAQEEALATLTKETAEVMAQAVEDSAAKPTVAVPAETPAPAAATNDAALPPAHFLFNQSQPDETPR